MLGSSGMIVVGWTGLDWVVGMEWDSAVDGESDMGCGENVKGGNARLVMLYRIYVVPKCILVMSL